MITSGTLDWVKLVNVMCEPGPYINCNMGELNLVLDTTSHVVQLSSLCLWYSKMVFPHQSLFRRLITSNDFTRSDENTFNDYSFYGLSPFLWSVFSFNLLNFDIYIYVFICWSTKYHSEWKMFFSFVKFSEVSYRLLFWKVHKRQSFVSTTIKKVF